MRSSVSNPDPRFGGLFGSHAREPWTNSSALRFAELDSGEDEARRSKSTFHPGQLLGCGVAEKAGAGPFVEFRRAVSKWRAKQRCSRRAQATDEAEKWGGGRLAELEMCQAQVSLQPLCCGASSP